MEVEEQHIHKFVLTLTEDEGFPFKPNGTMRCYWVMEIEVFDGEFQLYGRKDRRSTDLYYLATFKDVEEAAMRPRLTQQVQACLDHFKSADLVT